MGLTDIFKLMEDVTFGEGNESSPYLFEVFVELSQLQDLFLSKPNDCMPEFISIAETQSILHTINTIKSRNGIMFESK